MDLMLDLQEQRVIQEEALQWLSVRMEAQEQHLKERVGSNSLQRMAFARKGYPAVKYRLCRLDLNRRQPRPVPLWEKHHLPGIAAGKAV